MKSCPSCGWNAEKQKQKERREWVQFMNKKLSKNLKDWSEYENKISKSERKKTSKPNKR